MGVRDLAFTGLGLLIAAPIAVAEGFNTLSRRGEQVRPDDGTVAGYVDRLVTRDVPSGVGHLLGMSVDATVRSIELVRRIATEWPGVAHKAAERMFQYADLPSVQEVADLRQRVEALAVRLEQVQRGAGVGRAGES